MSSQDDSQSQSPPPPSSDDSSSSSSSSPPPPSSDSSSAPPPPSDTSSAPPPPSGGDNSSSSSSPPPPSPDNNTSPPPPDDSNNNDNSSPPPPPPSNDNNNKNNNNNQSPPPPPPDQSSSSNNNGSPPPPPPPPESSSHGHTALSPPNHSSSKSSHDKSLTTQQKQIIAGVAAGAGLLLLMLIVFIAACAKRKKRKPRDEMGYYRDNSQGHNANGYYSSGPQVNWPQNYKMQSADHTHRMPPSAQVSSEHGWPIAPPPPPPMMSSSELSSAAFSGPHSVPPPPPHPALALGFNQSSFNYNDLAVATEGFSRDKLLGQGGFGYVHKGVLPNGKLIAVKSLKANSGQGEREFQAEVDIISRVHHRHLVSLVGYCIAGPQRMLVYEFVHNNTLEYHLHESGQVMDFPTRHKIALGSAKGFAYLHEDCHPRIIHRDIKAANILLDENFEAKVADFGLAKLATDNNTHVSTRIMGTFGYLAPEYASSGKLTEKSDVYSFGVVLLELITGKKPVDVNSDEDSLVEWARPILMKAADGGGFEELVDPRLGNNYDYEQMLAMIACAGASIRHSGRRRPKMSQIVRALEGDVSLEDLTEGMKLGNNGIFGSSGGSSEYDSSIQREKMKKSTGLLSSQEFSSSEYGMTGEYVHSGGESAEIRPNGAPVRAHTP